MRSMILARVLHPAWLVVYFPNKRAGHRTRSKNCRPPGSPGVSKRHHRGRSSLGARDPMGTDSEGTVRMRRSKTIVVLMALGMLTACQSNGKTTANSSPNSTAETTHKQGGTVTISNEQGQTWPCQFNPFNPAVNLESLGFVYEPLIYVNLLKNQAETPMLASSYQWSADKKSIVFTIRDGVKWSDGQPFSGDDVAFTFNLMKQTPATDHYALWTGAGLQSVAANGNQVTMTFSDSAEP